jgi:hypothetical protein
MTILEGVYKTHLKKEIERELPGCVILKNDTDYQQGIPDMLILFRNRWAMLEVKTSDRATRQPNQPWWIERLGVMSFAAFIYPENEEAVLDELYAALKPHRSTRIAKSQ